VVDRDLHVRKWSRPAEDLWGLRSDEVVQKNFLNLGIGLPVERLRTAIRSCLAGDADVLDLTVDATNRRGRPIRVRVTCTPLTAAPAKDSRGVILVMEEELDGRL
jgi:two-component system CheB/CheR fusion protein